MKNYHFSFNSTLCILQNLTVALQRTKYQWYGMRFTAVMRFYIVFFRRTFAP